MDRRDAICYALTMPLTLYNTLTRRKEMFEPLDPERVRLYVCGPTVYDRAHIGNGRANVVFDVLYRLLRDVYGREHVIYIRNITDVEDKINAAARKNNEPIAALTMEALNSVKLFITGSTNVIVREPFVEMQYVPGG